MRFRTTRQNDSRARSGEAPSRSRRRGDQGDPALDLLLGRLPAGRQSEGQLDLLGGVGAGLALRSRSAKALACRFMNEPLSMPSAWVGWVVANRTGDERSVSARSKLSRIGRIKRPLDVDVDAPPGLLLGRRLAPARARDRLPGHHLGGDLGIDARPVHLQAQGAGDGEDRVADLLGRQPPHVEPPEAGRSSGRRRARVGSGLDDIL